MAKLELNEQAPTLFATTNSELIGRRYKVRLIEGDRLGSSAYYPAEVLKRDGAKIFKSGTPMYFNHQTLEEKASRPHGRVQDFAGELAGDAYYENDGLYADIEVFEHQIPIIKALKDRIGISIRASADTETQNMNGRMVPVVTELLAARSADFVVKAGAGGKIVSVLESALDTTLEEESENMDEVLKAIQAMRDDLDKRLTTLEESAKAVPVVEEKVVEEGAKPEDINAQVMEIAEALGTSELDAEGRSRVLELHKATKKPLKELIEAEEAYVKRNSAVIPEIGGKQEREIEEEEKGAPYSIPTPSFWGKKGN